MQPVWKYFRLQGKSEKAHDNILASSKVYCLHLTFLLMCIFLHFRRPNLKEQYRVEKIETNLSTINLSFSDSPWTHKLWAHRIFLQVEFWNIFGRSGAFLRKQKLWKSNPSWHLVWLKVIAPRYLESKRQGPQKNMSLTKLCRRANRQFFRDRVWYWHLISGGQLKSLMISFASHLKTESAI